MTLSCWNSSTTAETPGKLHSYCQPRRLGALKSESSRNVNCVVICDIGSHCNDNILLMWLFIHAQVSNKLCSIVTNVSSLCLLQVSFPFGCLIWNKSRSHVKVVLLHGQQYTIFTNAGAHSSLSRISGKLQYCPMWYMFLNIKRSFF